MKELWDDSEYAHLQLTSQNLRDQASRLEKTLRNVTELIDKNLRVGYTEERQQEQQTESENSDLTVGNECEELPTTVADLHMEYTPSKESKDLIESANNEINYCL